MYLCEYLGRNWAGSLKRSSEGSVELCSGEYAVSLHPPWAGCFGIYKHSFTLNISVYRNLDEALFEKSK